MDKAMRTAVQAKLTVLDDVDDVAGSELCDPDLTQRQTAALGWLHGAADALGVSLVELLRDALQ